MSNSWQFHFHGKFESKISQNDIAYFLRHFTENGFDFYDYEKIRGTSLGGDNEISFQNPYGACNYLTINGGGVPLFNQNDDTEIFWVVDPIEVNINFSISGSLTRNDKERIELLFKLFKVLSLSPFVRRAFAIDEWGIEYLLPGPDFSKNWNMTKNDFLMNQHPKVLFWLNYFSQMESSPESIRFHGPIKPQVEFLENNGTIIRVSENPEIARFAILKENEYYIK